MELNQDKLPLVYSCLKENKFNAWLIIARDTVIKSEPILEVFGNIQFKKETAFLFTQSDFFAVVSQDEFNDFASMEGIDKVIPYQDDIMDEIHSLLDVIKPDTLALNFNKNDSASDGLTYGFKQKLDKCFAKLDFNINVVSAFPVIAKVRGIKTASQLALIEHVGLKARDYLLSIPDMLTESSTSLDIFNYLQEVAYKDGYTMSWTPSQCPGVSVDPDVPAGHMGIIETPVLKGCTINIDYGVARDGYCSDLQRMFYVLKDDEVEAPQEVMNAFNVIKKGIRLGFDALVEGTTGFEVDKVTRDYITSKGFESWNAALGHQVGHATHDGGTILANRRPRYDLPELIDTPLDIGNVFTIEPSVNIPQGRMAMEEMAVITKDGAKWVVPPQEEIILVRLKKEN